MIQWSNSTKIQHAWIDHWLKTHWWSSLSDCYSLNPIDLWHYQDYHLLFKLNLLVAMASTWFGLWSIYRQLRSVPNNGKATFSHSRTFSCASISRSLFLVRCVLGISCEWQYASPCPPTPPTESLRASVSPLKGNLTGPDSGCHHRWNLWPTPLFVSIYQCGRIPANTAQHLPCFPPWWHIRPFSLQRYEHLTHTPNREDQLDTRLSVFVNFSSGFLGDCKSEYISLTSIGMCVCFNFCCQTLRVTHATVLA